MPQLLTDSYEDPILVESANKLVTKLQITISHHMEFDQSLLDNLEQVVYDHRQDHKRHFGKEFPPLNLFVLPSYRFVSFERADLNDSEIRGKLIMIARAFAEKGIKLEENEFAAAVVRTWPKYKPPIEELRNDPKLANGYA